MWYFLLPILAIAQPLQVPTNANEMAALQHRKLYDCTEVNWNDYATEIGIASSLAQFATNSSYLTFLRKYFDETTLQIHREEPLFKNILGAEYEMETILSNIKIKGLRTIALKPIAVTSDTTISLGAVSDGNLLVDADFTVNYVKKSWTVPVGKWEICPWEWYFWRPCPSRTVRLSSEMEILDLEADVEVEVHMFECAKSNGFWNKLACHFTSAWSYTKSLFDDDNMLNNGFAAEVLRRIQSLSIVHLDIAFHEVKAKVEFVKYLGNDADGDTLKQTLELNAKTHITNGLINGVFKGIISKAINYGAKKAATDAIELVSPLFQSKCYRRKL